MGSRGDEGNGLFVLIVVPSFFINQDEVERNNLSEDNRLHWGKSYSMLKEPKITNKPVTTVNCGTVSLL